MSAAVPTGSRAPGRALCVTGPPGPEKSAFLGRLAAFLGGRGFQVAVLRLDAPLPLPDDHKDTGRFRQAGARLSVLAAPGWLQLTYHDPETSDFPSLSQALDLLWPLADLVLVDGEGSGLPRVVLAPAGSPDRPLEEQAVWAVVGRAPAAWRGPVFSPQETADLGQWLLKRWGLV